MIRIQGLQHVQQNAFPGEKGQQKFKGLPGLPCPTVHMYQTTKCLIRGIFSHSLFLSPLSLCSNARAPTSATLTNSSQKYERGRVT